MRKKTFLWLGIVSILLILVAFDRANWANVSQWREDQATNLWLGYYYPNPLNLPIGLISSVSVPNPNGMPLFAKAFSWLPNLGSVSLALGILQGGLVILAGWLVAGASPLFLALTLPALASVILRATSVEFWSQWVMTPLNLAFFALLILYIRRPTILKLPFLILPMLLAPALYLAGLDNAVVYFLLTAGTMLVKRPKGNWRAWGLSALACGLLVFLAFYVTWRPYFRIMTDYTIPGSQINAGVIQKRLSSGAQTIIQFPVWSTQHWAVDDESAYYQSSPKILPASALQIQQWSRTACQAQAILFLVLLGFGLVWSLLRRIPLRQFFRPGQGENGGIILLAMAFVILSFLLSPLLGGPEWAKGERIDQTVQYLPFFLFAWFGLPFVIQLPRPVLWIGRGATILILTGFTATSLVLGYQVISAHLDYRGSYLSEADVPLVQKEQAIDFIARDWMATSTDKKISVTYDLGGERWDFVPGLGLPMMKWYDAPFTMGRAFDYELFRVYGLINRLEGEQLRDLYPTRYLVSYAFMPEPYYPGHTFKNYLFGRLRVSVVQ